MVCQIFLSKLVDAEICSKFCDKVTEGKHILLFRIVNYNKIK